MKKLPFEEQLKAYIHVLLSYWASVGQSEPENICDRLCINHPSPAKCKFWVRPKITAKSAQYRYSVLAIGVMYGVLATLCRSTMLRLHIVFPGATPLLPFTDKECGDVNGRNPL